MQRSLSTKVWLVQWKRLLICGLWWCSLAALLHAQPTAPLKFEQVAVGPFTSEMQVADIVQDPLGFLWIGTRFTGLYRYDGYSFVAYKHDPQQAASLGRNEVYCLFVDRAGQLWVSLDGGGLDRFEPRINGFIHYQHDPKNPVSLSHDFGRGIWQDRSGYLWIGTSGGVNLFNPATNGFTQYHHDPANPNSLSYDVVYCVMQDKGGDLWFGTARGWIGSTPRLNNSSTSNLHCMSPPAKFMRSALWLKITLAIFGVAVCLVVCIDMNWRRTASNFIVTTPASQPAWDQIASWNCW